MIESFERHPIVAGLLSASSSVGFSLIGLLSKESTVRLLGSVGAILGIVLTCLSIMITLKKLLKK